MNLPIFALFGFSRRLESRHYLTYLARTIVAGVILLYLVLAKSVSSAGAAGLQFFTFVVYVNLIFITLAGLSYFASAIAEEKEEMTLGLLRMTQLSPLAILFGKAASRGVGVSLLLLVQLPFTFLAITLGGVAMAQIVAAYATLLAYLIFIGGLAVFCSLLAPNTAKAGFLVAAALAVFYGGPAGGRACLALMVKEGWIKSNGRLETWLAPFPALLQMCSPVERVQEILATGLSGPVVGFQVVTNAVAGIGLFLLACPLFDWLTREQHEPAPQRGVLSTRRRRFTSPGRAWRNALMWKDFYFQTGGVVLMTGKTVLYGVLILGVYRWWHHCDATVNPRFYCGELRYVLWAAMLIEAMMYASRIFNQETTWRTLGSISLLPISAGRLAVGKALGCLMGMIPVTAYYAAAWVLTLRSAGLSQNIKEEILVAVTSLCQVIFLAHLIAYLSLRMKRGAVAMALLISVVVVPILYAFVGVLGIFYMGQFASLGGYAAFLIIGSIVVETRIMRALRDAAGA